MVRATQGRSFAVDGTSSTHGLSPRGSPRLSFMAPRHGCTRTLRRPDCWREGSSMRLSVSRRPTSRHGKRTYSSGMANLGASLPSRSSTWTRPPSSSSELRATNKATTCSPRRASKGGVAIIAPAAHQASKCGTAR